MYCFVQRLFLNFCFIFSYKEDRSNRCISRCQTMNPEYSLQDVVRRQLCDKSNSHLHCDICQMGLCKQCVGTHIVDGSKKHKVVPYNKRASSPYYPKCIPTSNVKFTVNNVAFLFEYSAFHPTNTILKSALIFCSGMQAEKRVQIKNYKNLRKLFIQNIRTLDLIFRFKELNYRKTRYKSKQFLTHIKATGTKKQMQL